MDIGKNQGSPKSLPRKELNDGSRATFALSERMKIRHFACRVDYPPVNALGKIGLYLLAIVLIGAILSPPIYWGTQALASHGYLTGLAGFPFYRFFSRTAQVSAIVLLVPLLFWLKIRSVSEFGLRKNSRGIRDLGAGVLLALVPVVLFSAGLFLFGVYRVKDGLAVGALAKIFLTASVVAVVEEFLFRGVALGLAARTFGRWTGATAVSLVFAGVHFLKPAKQPDAAVEWWTGFAQIPRVIEAAPPPALFALGFLSLFVVGMLLAWSALATRSLWLPIGLHAGWVIGQQGLQWLGKYRVKPPEAYLPWVGPNVVSGAVPTGLCAIGVLLITGLGIWIYLKRNESARRVSGAA